MNATSMAGFFEKITKCLYDVWLLFQVQTYNQNPRFEMCICSNAYV